MFRTGVRTPFLVIASCIIFCGLGAVRFYPKLDDIIQYSCIMQYYDVFRLCKYIEVISQLRSYFEV